MRINLLPPDLLERQRTRRRTIVIVVAGVAVLVALGGLYLLQAKRVSDVQAGLDEQLAQNAQLQQQIADLQEFGALEQELEENQTLLATLLENEVRWSGLLRDISLVIPGEAWLRTLSGTIAPLEPDPTAAEPVPTGLIGQITFEGVAFDHPAVALWLSRLEEIEGFVNPWLTSAGKALIGETEIVEFISSVDVSESAAVVREGGPA